MQHERCKELDGTSYSRAIVPPTAFIHGDFVHPEQYPRGVTDMVRYWAKGKIFGGVILFDRGKTDGEVRLSMRQSPISLKL